MAVEVDNRTSQHPDEATLAALVDRVLDDQGAGDAEVAIILLDPDPMRALNREYRARDEVTDVLAFPIDERDDLPTGMPRLLGDVVICLERCAERASRATRRGPSSWSCRCTACCTCSGTTTRRTTAPCWRCRTR